MADAAVVDASPLIYLTEVGRLELLRLAGDAILVPEAVAEEVRRWGDEDPAARALATTEWLRIVPSPVVPASIHTWDLGPGEAAVLTWAMENRGTTAIIDDMAARRCAAAHRISVRGTLGLVLTAKQRGQIPAARPVLEAMRRAGMYLSDTVMSRALAEVGE